MNSLLTDIIAAPLLGALLVLFIPRDYRVIIRLITLLATAVSMVCAITLFAKFQTGLTQYQFEQSIPWVKSLGINYHVGVDGVNVGLILMGGIVAFTAACVSREI